jgi:integrative and conjugative element protein (TIGR02256 family)
MLIGYVAEHDSDAIVITGTIAAGPQAIRRNARFVPDGDWQQQQLDDRYAASGRTATFLGDWHSHPGGRPVPSWRDNRTASKVARDPKARAESPLTLLLAGSSGQWKPVAWRFEGRLRHATLLEI